MHPTSATAGADGDRSVGHRGRRILPVVVLEDAAAAAPLAAALTAGGLHSVEVTFRTAAAADAIRAMSERPGPAGRRRHRAHPGAGRPGGRGGRPVRGQPRLRPGRGPALPGTRHPGLSRCGHRDRDPDGPRRRPGHGQVLPGRAARRARHDQGAGRAVPRRCGSSRPAGSTPPTWPTTSAIPAVLAVGGTWMVAPDLLAAGRLGRGHPADRRRRGRRRPPPECRRTGNQRVNMLELRPADQCRYDLVSLGEIMLRLDPGEGRVRTARGFRAWEGGGEYNVARGLRRCFGLRTAVVTAFADNEVGRLLEDLVLHRRRGHRADQVVPVRRDRPHRPQRTQLHRARLRRARRGRHLRPWAHRRQPAPRRRRRLGSPLRHAGRALAAHRRHLRRPLRDHPGDHRGGDGRRPPARHGHLVRPQLPAQPLEGGRRAGAGAGGQPAAGPATST